MSEAYPSDNIRSDEDQLCIAEIQRFKDHDPEVWERTEEVIEVEKHYNFYGDRGVADLYTREAGDSGIQTDRVVEFKSDAAIREATGANEILRQFNRMCEYFYRDPNIETPHGSAWTHSQATFELCFIPTPYAVEHVLNNLDLYHSVKDPVVESNFCDGRVLVTFRDVGSGGPLLVSAGNTRFSAEEIRGMGMGMFGEDHEIFGGAQS